MKVSVCGKGGSGKSTLVALLASEMAERGYRVLVVDSDESNSGLFRLLGFDHPPVTTMELLGGKKKVKEKMSQPGIFTESQIPLEKIPKPNLLQKDGIMLVTMGKIVQSLEGCACPIGRLSREFLNKLSLKTDEVVIVDTEAGVEHFGRGVEASVDSVLIVVDPSFDSLELAGRINKMAGEIGISNIGAILNKVPSDEIADLLKDDLKKRHVNVIGCIHTDPTLFTSSLQGKAIGNGVASGEIKGVVDTLLSRMEK